MELHEWKKLMELARRTADVRGERSHVVATRTNRHRAWVYIIECPSYCICRTPERFP